MNDKSDILRVIGNNAQQAKLSKGLTQEALSDRIEKTPNFISIIYMQGLLFYPFELDYIVLL